jgi:hypothetical protein
MLAINKSDLGSYYHRNLSHHITMSMTYLHTSVNWTITTIIGGGAAIILRDRILDEVTAIYLAALTIVSTHFLVRASKAYLNLIRFTFLDRVFTECLSTEDFSRVNAAIQSYHLDWKNPLRLRSVMMKMFFEIGYFYFYCLLIFPLVYIVAHLGTHAMYGLLSITILASITEIWWGLWKSPYMRQIEVDTNAERYR